MPDSSPQFSRRHVVADNHELTRRLFVQTARRLVHVVFLLFTVGLVLAACSESPLSPDIAAVPGVASVVSEGATIKVTTNADAGAGSFRAAITTANSDETIGSIKFDKNLGTIVLASPITFTGSQALDINGSGNEVSGSSLADTLDAFTATGGGDLSVRQLTLRNAPGSGIAVLIPSSATGIVSVTFQDVIVRGNGKHGALINDQTGYLTDPLSTSPAGSSASLRIRIHKSTFQDNGFADIDLDGLRVNEGGVGSIDAIITSTDVIGNGGDGIELDERGDGDAVFVVEQSRLNANGAFTALDFDDGIDVDEAGNGDIDGQFNQVEANDNFEQGIDINENDAGHIRAFMNQVEASDNAEEGVEFEEDDDFAGGGDIIATLQSVTTLRNGANDGDAGLKLREKGAGNLSAQIIKPVSSQNQIGGILVREDAAGNLQATIENAVAVGNGGEGIEFDENSSGNLDASVLRATASDNDDAGVAAEQATSGTGILRIQNLTATGNGDGPVKNDAGVVVQ